MTKMATQQPPEEKQAAEWEPLAPAKLRRVHKCYEHGKELMSAQKKYDFNYVHTLLAECAASDPGNADYVDAMLDNLKAKFDNNRKKGKGRGFANRGALKKAVAKEEWKDVLQLGVDALKSNPWDASTLRALANACAAFQFIETEQRYLRMAYVGNPKDVEVARHCARVLARLGDFDKAINCWRRIEDIANGDKEAAKMITDLTIAKNRRLATGEAGEEGPADQQEKQADEQKQRRTIELTKRQRLERELAEDPTNLDAYLALGKLLLAEKRYGNAQVQLTRALEVEIEGEPRVRQQLEELMIHCMRNQAAIAEQQAAQLKTSDAADQAKKKRAELNEVQLTIFAARSQRDPENMQLKFDLGKGLRKAGRYEEATEQLQAAQADPATKAAARLELGECFLALKQYKKSLQCFQSAASGAGEEQLDTKKTALYRLGMIAAALKEKDLAKASFTELLQLDPEFKDAQARLDKLG